MQLYVSSTSFILPLVEILFAATQDSDLSNGMQRLDIYRFGKWHQDRKPYQFWKIKDACQRGMQYQT